jgi:hypothetical protein
MKWTIRDAIERRDRVTIYCEGRGCNHGSQLDLVALGERLGLDHGALRADLCRKFRCTKCGSREVSFRLSSEAAHIASMAHGGFVVSDGGNAYRKAKGG